MARRALVILAVAFALILASGTARAEDGGGMKSPAAFGFGVVLSGVGAAGLAAGGWLFASAGDPCGDIPRDEVPSQNQIDACQSGVNKKVGGVFAMVTGGAFLLGGIPLIAVGASPDASRARISLDVSPTGGRFRVEF